MRETSAIIRKVFLLSGSAKLAVSQQYSVAFGDEIIAGRNKMQTGEFRDNAGQYSFLSGSAKLAVSQQYSVAFGDEIIAEGINANM